MSTTGNSPQRELQVTLDRDTAKALGSKNCQLHVARSVIAQGKLMFNLVWQSKFLEPVSTLSWTSNYAFNWTSQIPQPGTVLICEGQWMQCNFGQVLDIDEFGFFNISSATPDPATMMIGKNAYHSQAAGGEIHIVVGIRNSSTGQYDPCFLDPDGFFPNQSGAWEPQETVQWWYESGAQTASMIDSQRELPVEVGDFAKSDPTTGTFKKQSSFSISSGKWTTNPIPCK